MNCSHVPKPTMADTRLDGRGVLITRPREQAGELANAVKAQGGVPILFPSIEIHARSRAEIKSDAASLDRPDITIFISRNAARFGFEWAHGHIAAIGPTTAAEITALGGPVDVVPQTGFDSEHLLAEDVFKDIAGMTIRIIRGNAGRELLADTLRARGANVHYLSTYSRELPTYTANVLSDLERQWRDGGIFAVVMLSVHSLDNLLKLLPDWCREQLATTPLVTPAARVLKEVLGRFPECPAYLAAGPTASEIADSVVAAAAGHPGSSQ